MKWLVRLLNSVLLFLTTDLILLCSWFSVSLWVGIPGGVCLAVLFVVINIVPRYRAAKNRWAVMNDGRELVYLFLITLAANIAFQIWFGIEVFSKQTGHAAFFVNLVFCIVLEAVLAANGTLRMIILSKQLGTVKKVLFLFLWWLPVFNLVLLCQMVHTAKQEYELETEKEELNSVRKENEICRTKYPVLMVHGVFFRDLKYWNYWGRIPKELKRNGAEVYYGNQQSAASVEECAVELKTRIEEVVAETGAEKVNIIAHSKGGLDSRYAISLLGMDHYVASLTTINTPHRGCAFADYLLHKIPKSVCNMIARKYNSALKKLGDPNPDFMAAVQDLTEESCRAFNERVLDAENVYYQSTASKMSRWNSAPFPQWMSYLLVKHFDKDNDGLVGVQAAKWGSKFTLLETKGRRGISHGDMIDLNRENIKGFDVREFYVGVVHGLKEMGF